MTDIFAWLFRQFLEPAHCLPVQERSCHIGALKHLPWPRMLMTLQDRRKSLGCQWPRLLWSGHFQTLEEQKGYLVTWSRPAIPKGRPKTLKYAEEPRGSLWAEFFRRLSIPWVGWLAGTRADPRIQLFWILPFHLFTVCSLGFFKIIKCSVVLFSSVRLISLFSPAFPEHSYQRQNVSWICFKVILLLWVDFFLATHILHGWLFLCTQNWYCKEAVNLGFALHIVN